MQDAIKKRLRLINLSAVTAILVVLGATAGLGVYPLYAKATSSVKQAETLKTQLAELEGLSKTLTQVEGELKSTETRLGDAESRLPNSNKMNEFMQQLAVVAEQAGMQVDGITPKQLKDAGDYRALPVEITGEGSFDTCYKFLTGLRKMNRPTRLDNLVLQTSADNNAKGKSTTDPAIKISITISTFIAR